MNVFRSLVYTNLLRLSTRRSYSLKAGDAAKLSETTWDIIISGGGMVGCALACSLGSSSVLSRKNILLLESSQKTEYHIDPTKYSNRVCALNENTKDLFDGFNAWSKIADVRMKEVKKMVVWEACSDARIVFEHEGMKSEIAYVVENDVILKSLYATLCQLQNNVHVLTQAKAVDYDFSDRGKTVSVHLENDIVLNTKLLVGADGVNSLVRKKMGVKYISCSYDQRGIVATLKLSEPTENVVAWQRFLPTGPIALLPLTDDLCSLVWTVSLPMSEKLLKVSDEEFVDFLNAALWNEDNKNSIVESTLSTVRNVISSITPGVESIRQLPPSVLSVEPNTRAAFPLGLGHATEYVAPRVALIGDSAHRVHPLAGQGVNLGFGDVKCLTECLETSVYNGNSIGNFDALLEYEVKRQRHVLPTMITIDVLNRLYKSELMPVVLLRSLGTTLVDSLHPVKNVLIRQASA